MIRKRWIPLVVAGLLTIGIAEPVCDEEEDNGDNGAENGAEEPSENGNGGGDSVGTTPAKATGVVVTLPTMALPAKRASEIWPGRPAAWLTWH
ncbi:MAG: hypothetical protein U5Q44_03485 [Dehalococcoidia bacterium]|nr:hypothetical protein [Dehalococcoidia bacterium]